MLVPAAAIVGALAPAVRYAPAASIVCAAAEVASVIGMSFLGRRA